MRIKTVIVLAALFCGLLMVGGGVWAMSSGSYAIDWDVIGGGGEPASSTNYAIEGTIGQAAAEASFSNNCGLWSGYWYPAKVSGINNPPNTPSNPSPGNHAVGVSVNADLSWNGGDPDIGDTVTYDVYFGTSASPPLVSDNQGGTSYDPGTLADNTEYYWQIVATDNHAASTTGLVWDFTTGQPGPTVTWNCPLGGEPLIAPNPGKGRPDLSVPAACDGITASAGAELWGIYYLVETGPQAGTWLWYIPGFATSTLTQLELGELYYVVVSGPCTLTIPQ